MKLFFTIIIAYLMGSIPFSYLFSKLKGVDPRKAGTRNVGASNVLVVAGPGMAVLAFLGDFGKGFLAVILARTLGLSHLGVALSGLAAVIGHDFSIFLGFKGGKGLATAGGVLLALDPVFTFLAMLLWILCMIVLRYFIPSTVLMMIFVPAMMWMGSWRVEYIIFGVLNAGLSVYAHRQDLQRFFRGEELTIGESIAKYLKK